MKIILNNHPYFQPLTFAWQRCLLRGEYLALLVYIFIEHLYFVWLRFQYNLNSKKPNFHWQFRDQVKRFPVQLLLNWLWRVRIIETFVFFHRASRRCWTRLAKRAGRNFRSGSFSSDRRRANISARGRWCGNNVGGSLAFDGERILEWHIVTKYFAGRLTAVDVFYSIHKATIFNAEQLILGITLRGT